MSVQPVNFATADRNNMDSVTSGNRTNVSGFASQANNAVNNIQKKPHRQVSRPKQRPEAGNRILFDEEAANRFEKEDSFDDQIDNADDQSVNPNDDDVIDPVTIYRF